MRDGTCSESDCGRPTLLRGWCKTHYTRWRKTGSPGGPVREWRKQSGPCRVQGCDREARKKGLCSPHYNWSLAHDGQEPIEPLRPSEGFRLADADAGYRTMHARLYREQAPARSFQCVDCNAPAREWSYDHSDPDERFDPKINAPFSLKPEHYQPRCKKCHNDLDQRLARLRRRNADRSGDNTRAG